MQGFTTSDPDAGTILRMYKYFRTFCHMLSSFFRLFSSLKTLQTLQIFGFLSNAGISVLKKSLPGVDINSSMFSTIARATGTQYKKTIWGMRCVGYGN